MTLNLSYIIATYNRLPFLKITLERLMSELQQDEEIVVVDGNSSDGSKQYLQQLFEEDKIQQFISEPDKNQAHAWNKALLTARGTLIKKIIDDDVYCYNAIRECKSYMLVNPQFDVLISNDLSSSLENYKHISKNTRLPQFEKWKKGLCRSFTFGDVHMLIRKSSLAFIGLYNTGYVMMDWEYSLRMSHLQANIVYYTGYNAVSVAHPQTVTSLQNSKAVNEQGKRANYFYEYEGDRAHISQWSKIKIAIGSILHKTKPAPAVNSLQANEDFSLKYDYLYNYIAELNNAGTFTFINKR